ncbi:hypothetical protein Ciccas_000879 [Cichlidogyrus casuarinus]|uniref:Uncharacterized protein n=1 Tax=Cichlidogyrus casuarinus TaxID=1844966 RepID=A0ABD2QLM6_9PLAT
MRTIEGSDEPEPVAQINGIENGVKSPKIDSPRQNGSEFTANDWAVSIDRLTNNLKQLQNDFGRLNQEQKKLVKRRQMYDEDEDSCTSSLSYSDNNTHTIYHRSRNEIYSPANLLSQPLVSSAAPFYPVSWYPQPTFQIPSPLTLAPIGSQWYSSWLPPASGQIVGPPMAARPPPHPYSSTELSTPRSQLTRNRKTSNVRKKNQLDSVSKRGSMSSSRYEDENLYSSDAASQCRTGREESRSIRLRKRHRVGSLPNSINEQEKHVSDQLRLDLSGSNDFAQHIISETEFDLNNTILADFANNNLTRKNSSSLTSLQRTDISSSKLKDLATRSFFVPLDDGPIAKPRNLSKFAQSSYSLIYQRKISNSSSALSNRSKASFADANSGLRLKDYNFSLPKIADTKKDSASDPMINGFDPATIEALRKNAEARRQRMEEDKARRDAIFKAYIEKKETDIASPRASSLNSSRRASSSLPRVANGSGKWLLTVNERERVRTVRESKELSTA